MMEKAFRFRIYPDEKQRRQIAKTIGCARLVYNDALDLRRQAWEVGCIRLTYNWTSQSLTELKKHQLFLKKVDKFALQNALRDLDQAYKNFFAGRARYPRFRQKHSHVQSYRTSFTNGNIAVHDDTIKLPKLGRIKAAVSRLIEGRITSATLSRHCSGRYFVSICCTDVESRQLTPVFREIEVSLGGEDMALKRLTHSVQRSKILQKCLSRKQRGSKNRRKAKIRLDRYYERIANQRRDFLQQYTTGIIRNYDLIIVNRLSDKGSSKDLCWNKTSKGAFVVMLEYKARWYGRRVQYIMQERIPA